MTQGIVSRISVTSSEHSGVKAIILLVGSSEVFEGEVGGYARDGEMSPEQVVSLTKPGDEVSFSLDRDFVDRFLNFKNLTLAQELSV